MVPRKVTPAQFKSAMQKAQRDQQRAVNDYNRGVRQYNSSVKKAITDYNREVRNYNAQARQHNQRVESQRRRLNQELRRLQSRASTTTTFSSVRTSTASFVTAYDRAEQCLSGGAGLAKEYLDQTSDDAANSVYLINVLDGDGDPANDLSPEELTASSLNDELSEYGQDLVDRWNGALYALSPQNPDAARHFCTSAREVVIKILDISAPDHVVREMPGCEMFDGKTPTRRSKVSYLFRRQGIESAELAEAVSEDVGNVLSLFRVFNDATHGHAGRFSITELSAIRTRVETAVAFLSRIAKAA